MEIYILIALIFIYLITAFAGNPHTTKRIWALAYIISFVCCLFFSIWALNILITAI